MALKVKTPGPVDMGKKASADPAKATSPANVKTTFGTPKKQD